MSRPPVRRVALYGFLGSGNLGNDASLETVLAWFGEHHPQVRLSCITIAPEEVAARYGLPAVRLTCRPPRRLGGTTAGKVLARAADVPRSLWLAGSADAVVVPGMGVLEDTLGTRPWGMPVWLLLMAAACRVRRRPFVLLDVGAEPAVHRLTRLLHRATVRLAADVSYRDRWSARALRARTGKGGATIAPDLAFAHPAPTMARPEPGLLVVGVMAYYGREDDPVAGAQVRQDYLATMAELLAPRLERGGRAVLVGGDLVDLDVAWDLEKSLRTLLPDLDEESLQVAAETTFAGLTEQMARAEVVLASRYHNLICALRLGRPTISVSYAEKSRELLEGAGLGAFCHDIGTADAPVLGAHLDAAQEHAAELAERVAERTREHRAAVGRLLDSVAGHVWGLGSDGRG